MALKALQKEYLQAAQNEVDYERIAGKIVALVEDIVNSSIDANQILTAFGQVGLPAHPLFLQNVLQERWRRRRPRPRIHTVK